MSTSVSSVSNHFPSAENGFSTTTSGSVSSGATTVGLNSTSGYTNGETVVFVIDPANVKKQTFTGVIDTGGSQVTGVVWTAGTNVAHDAGTTVVDYATATHISMVTKGLLVQHKQDGTHANTITTDTINGNTATIGITVDGLNIKDGKLNTNNSVVTANITNASVTPEKLVASTGTSWVWQSWTPTLSGRFDDGDWTKTCKYVQIGKTVHFTINLISTAAAPMGGGSANAIFTLPVTAATIPGTDARQTIGIATLADDNGNSVTGKVHYASTTTGAIYYDAVSGSTVILGAVSSVAPFTWTTTDEISVIGTYEAA